MRKLMGVFENLLRFFYEIFYFLNFEKLFLNQIKKNSQKFLKAQNVFFEQSSLIFFTHSRSLKI
jgi:hypothetical protein